MSRPVPLKPLRVPAGMESFAWNIPGDSALNRAIFALNVLERGNFYHWKRIPKGWLNLAVVMRYGQRDTKLFLERHLLWRKKKSTPASRKKRSRKSSSASRR